MAVVDFVCVIHVHSTFSDGTATVPEIVTAAAKAHADAVLLTDHDSLDAARHGFEGWHGDVILLVGHEVTTHRGHMLAFGLEHEIDHAGATEAEICAEIDAQGGIGFAAHPFSRGGAVMPSIVRPHPWSALAECQSCGIELWSLVTDAAEGWRSPWAALRFLRHPEAALDGPPQRHLAQWDQLCARRRVPAIGGLDAHQSGVRVGRRVLSPMPNERYFKLLRTHVLLNEPPTRQFELDRGAIYEALREGRCYLAVDAFAPADGFTFHARGESGAVVPMGSEVGAGSWQLRASVPRPAELLLLRDGRSVGETRGTTIDHETRTTGCYRVEARLPDGGRERPWIFSNPIYIR